MDGDGSDMIMRIKLANYYIQNQIFFPLCVCYCYTCGQKLSSKFLQNKKYCIYIHMRKKIEKKKRKCRNKDVDRNHDLEVPY